MYHVTRDWSLIFNTSLLIDINCRLSVTDYLQPEIEVVGKVSLDSSIPVILHWSD